MKKGSSLIFYFFILSLLFTVSCKKIAEDKITGKWRRVNVVNVSSDSFEDLIFADDGTFQILDYSLNGNFVDTIFRTDGEYKMKVRSFKKILSITKTHGNTTNVTVFAGDWTIKKLTKKYLVFYKKDPGIDYWEFVKE